MNHIDNKLLAIVVFCTAKNNTVYNLLNSNYLSKSLNFTNRQTVVI